MKIISKLLVSVMVLSCSCKKSTPSAPTPVVDTMVATRQPNLAMPATPGSFTLRADGTILLNGQPHFPLGFYGEGFDGANALEENKNLITKLSEAGFNITYTEFQVLGAQTNQFLDHCATKGVYNIMNFYQQGVSFDPQISNFINQYKSKPSIMMWGVADDANTFEATDIRRKHNLVKTLDSRLTYQSFYDGGSKLDATVGDVDVSAMQSYPIFTNGDIDRDWALFREIVSKCRFKGKASIANLQIYRWPQQINYRWPTAQECDVQSYLALAAGFKGIIYYTFKDYRSVPNSTIDITQPALWKKVKQIAGELNGDFLGAILNGVHTNAKQGEGIYYGKWVYNNVEFIVAINARNSSNSIFIPVSGNKVDNLYDYRKSTLSIINGSLVGELGPLQVQVYKVIN